MRATTGHGVAPILPVKFTFYAPDRKAERPMVHLAGFTGILQVDGYAGCRALAERGDVPLAFRWAHVRRRFYELAVAGPAPITSEALKCIAELSAEVAVQGRHTVAIRTKTGEVEQANLELRYKRIRVQPPIGKRYPALMLTVIHAEEREGPPHRAPVIWKLITNIEVASPEEAIEKLSWYALRWKIEVFHSILKSGCKAEDAKLRTAERLVNLIAIFCILSWRIF